MAVPAVPPRPDNTATPVPTVAVAVPAESSVLNDTATPVPSVVVAVPAGCLHPATPVPTVAVASPFHSNDGLGEQGFIYEEPSEGY